MDLSYKILDIIQLILCIESALDNYSSEASDNIKRVKKEINLSRWYFSVPAETGIMHNCTWSDYPGLSFTTYLPFIVAPTIHFA